MFTQCYSLGGSYRELQIMDITQIGSTPGGVVGM